MQPVEQACCTVHVRTVHYFVDYFRYFLQFRRCGIYGKSVN